MPTIELILMSGDCFSVEVPSNAPLFAAADIVSRDLRQPAERMTFATMEGERLSKYLPVTEDMRLRVFVRLDDARFIVVEKWERLFYTPIDELSFKPWNPDDVELEDAVVYALAPIAEDDRFTIRSLK